MVVVVVDGAVVVEHEAAVPESVHLPQELESAAKARRFVKQVLTDWSRVPAIEDAALLATELVTNAVIHARSTVDLRLRRHGEEVTVQVIRSRGHVRVSAVYS